MENPGIVTEKPSSSKFKIILFSFIGVVFVSAIGIFSMVFSLSGASVDEAKSFLETLSEDPQAAYSMTSPEFQQVTSYEDFQNLLENFPSMTQVQSSSFPSRQVSMESDGSETHTLTGSYSSKDGSTQPIAIYLSGKEEEFFVIGFELNPTPLEQSSNL